MSRICKNKKILDDWEIDKVNGIRLRKDHSLLTLTECKTCYEIIIKMDGKTANLINWVLSSLRETARKDFERLSKRLLMIKDWNFRDFLNCLKASQTSQTSTLLIPNLHGNEEPMKIAMV